MNGAGPSSSSHAAGHSKVATNGSRSGGSSRGASKRARAAASADPGGTSTAVAIDEDDDETDPVTGELLSSQGFWKCKHCTVNNMDLNATTCEVCGLPRPD